MPKKKEEVGLGTLAIGGAVAYFLLKGRAPGMPPKRPPEEKKPPEDKPPKEKPPEDKKAVGVAGVKWLQPK